MYDLDGNTEDGFCHVAAHITIEKVKVRDGYHVKVVY